MSFKFEVGEGCVLQNNEAVFEVGYVHTPKQT